MKYIKEEAMLSFVDSGSEEFISLAKIAGYMIKLLEIAENYQINPQRIVIAKQEFPIQLYRFHELMIAANRFYHQEYGQYLIGIIPNRKKETSFELFEEFIDFVSIENLELILNSQLNSCICRPLRSRHFSCPKEIGSKKGCTQQPFWLT